MLKGLLFWCVHVFSLDLQIEGGNIWILQSLKRDGKNQDETASDNDGPKHALSGPFLGFHESIQIHTFKYQNSHPQNSSELEFENSSQHLRIRTKINKHIKKTSLMSSALFWTSICNLSVPYPLWDLNLYGSTGCLRLFKKGWSHFWRKPNDMTTVPSASNTSTWKIERWLLIFWHFDISFLYPGIPPPPPRPPPIIFRFRSRFFLVDIIRYINETPSDLCIHFLLHLLLHLCELLRRLRGFCFIYLIQVAVAPPSWDGTNLHILETTIINNISIISVTKNWKTTGF